jgi:hypothetical protein
MGEWKRYFKVTQRAPAKLLLAGSKKVVDFKSDNNPVDTMIELFESSLPYLELTNEGKAKFYGIKAEAEEPVTEEAPLAEQPTAEEETGEMPGTDPQQKEKKPRKPKAENKSESPD